MPGSESSKGWQKTIRWLLCGAVLCWPFFVLAETKPGTLVTNRPTDALQQQIERKKQTIKELEKSIADYKKKVAEKQLEATSFKNQIGILSNHVTQVELDIQETQAKLDTLQLEIMSLQGQIRQKQQIINHEKKLISELVRTMYQENNRGSIEVLFAYRTFSDFYNGLQHVQTVEQELGRSAKALRIATADLNEKKQQTEARQQSYQNLKATLAEQQQDLQEQLNYKQTLLDQTRSSEATYRTLLTNLRGQYQTIEGEIESAEKAMRQRLESENKLKSLPSEANGLFAWPTQSRYLTTYFHDPEYPFRRVFEHSGIDIRASQGTAVAAAGTGYVARAKRCTTSSCYSFVMIIHANGLATLYGHLSRVLVEEDQLVTTGDVIALSGGTPSSIGAGPFVTGPHLHFEIRRDGIPTDPLPFLPKEYMAL